MQETLMTPESCMQFLVWAYYYHGILPEPDKSFATYSRFAADDCQRLDALKASLFLTVTPESVFNACKQFSMARQRHEPCPWPQDALDTIFAKETEDAK